MPNHRGNMRHSIRAAFVAASLLASGLAHAEVIVDGKVRQVTADKLIKRDNLPCAYGDWRLETLPDGSLVLTRGKRCESGWHHGK